jgi:hypothetical protein
MVPLYSQFFTKVKFLLPKKLIFSSGTIPIPREASVREELVKEAEYYNLEALVDLLTKPAYGVHAHVHTTKRNAREATSR